MNRPLVLITEGSDPAPLAWLRDQVEAIEIGTDDPKFESRLALAEGLVIRTYTRIDSAFLAKAPKLRVVARAGVGIEHIDVKACRARGVEVVHTPDANSIAVGDFVFGVMIQLIRPWVRFKERALEPKEFKKVRSVNTGKQLDELTIGIIGMGRVGKRVGHIAANGFGMRVLYNDLLDMKGKLDFPATSVEKPQLIREADVLTLHVDMRPGNEHLIGRQQIASMKQGAILINCSRGEVLDAQALADAIRSKHLGGAAVDVFDPEPPPSTLPLLNLDNVILTPHMASRTKTAMDNMGWVVRDVVAVLNGQKPKWPAP